MAQDAAFQKRVQRIGEIVEQLELTADPNARAMGKELLECLMALHGAALERMLEITSNAGEPGADLVRAFSNDELISSVLILYGLHPDDLRSRVTRSLERSRPYLASHGASAELLAIGDDGAVSVRLDVKSGGCGSTASLVKSTLEIALQEAAPDATSIVVEETHPAQVGIGFVPIAALEGHKSLETLVAGRLEGAAD